MRCLQKINQCGNAAHFAIPRAAMFWLGWLPGELLVLEVLEDKSIRLRRCDPNELAPKHPPRIVFDRSFPAQP